MAPHQEALTVDGSLIGWLLQIIVALLEEVQALRAKLVASEKDSTTLP